MCVCGQPEGTRSGWKSVRVCVCGQPEGTRSGWMSVCVCVGGQPEETRSGWMSVWVCVWPASTCSAGEEQVWELEESAVCQREVN